MRWWTAAAVGALLVSCGGRDWRQAKRAGTADAYRAIAADLRHPKQAKAARRAERLDWAHAVEADSAAAWRAYLSHQPTSSRAPEARQRRLDARWREVQQADDRASYERFLAEPGGSAFAAQARQRLDELAWEEATGLDTPDAYGRYLVRNHTGAFVAQATARRQELLWAAAQAADRPAEYKAYLQRFPSGARADDARAALDSFRFKGVAVRVVARSLHRPDSLTSYRAQLDGLRRALERDRLAHAWLEPIDARDRAAGYDPLITAVRDAPEGHATLVIELRERQGDAFRPSGHATVIDAVVHLVPPGRERPMHTATVQARTGPQVYVEGDRALHLDAQRRLADAILAADFGFAEWRR